MMVVRTVSKIQGSNTKDERTPMAEEAGVMTELTIYSIRHSWATTAKYTDISTALIREGLGHNSVKTTEVYPKDFENASLDEITEKAASMI